MSCPYLTEVTMAFCRAFPVKKLVPSDRVLTDSACDGECYAQCPVYRDATARLGGTAAAPAPTASNAASKGGTP